jgi:hypothetical protein
MVEIKIPLKADGEKKSIEKLIKEVAKELNQYNSYDDMRLMKFTKTVGAITLEYDVREKRGWETITQETENKKNQGGEKWKKTKKC